ncbi:retrovirus-related Pol polyprotein from transposon 297 [Trichonephila clavipes]|nr:retrovirus-related Pol polyprotein from transposon 297 [Trichonephila clavipes]
MHRTLKRILRVLYLEAIPDWEKILPQALFALRTVLHDSTGFSPAELVHGKNLRTPAMLLYEKLTEEESVESSVVDNHDEEEDMPSLELENEMSGWSKIINDVQLSSKLSQIQRGQFKELLYEYSNLFSNIPGCTNLAEHDIELESDRAIVAKPYDDHLKHLKDVLDRLRSAKLHIKPSKCQFAQEYVKYFGHLVGQGLRTPGELKVLAIKDFPIPTNKTKVRAFLGLSGYYRRYIPEFSLSNRSSTDRFT